jgi:hypothetical protein
MSDTNSGTTWGKCGAFGCPLTGSLGRGDMWVCFCHSDALQGAFQDVTRAIRNHQYLADATLDIRRYFGSEDWPTVYRQIQRRFIEAGRRDLLLGEADASPHKRGPVVKLWLMRLEFELLRLTQDGTRRALSPTTQPTAAVAGPSHIADYIEKQQGENHGS